MPATKFSRIDINLIGGEDFSHTPMGRVITWATTYGRYIMILTEIVVLLAFISRFSLDRRLTDLKEEITQKQAIIEANSDLEQTVRMVQQKLQTIKTLIASQLGPTTTITDIAAALPPGVYLESLDVSEKGAKMTVIAATTQGVSTFLASLKGNSRFTNIELGDIRSRPTTGSHFDLTIQIGQSAITKK